MATVKYSPIVADVRGKAADAVFAAWKGRGYIRKRVIPANPQSAAQTNVREALARCVRLWRSLSAAIKAVQDSYAAGYRMSGYNWFVKNNRVDEESYDSYKLTPPNIDIDKPLSISLTDSGGGTCQVDWTGGSQGAGYYISIWSRLVETGEEVEEWTLEEEGSTLASAETANVTIAASKTSRIAIAVELAASDEYSECVSDEIAMGA